jgi:hydroxymethylbilane synthase
MTHSPTLRLGTRGSALARWQAEWVAGQLAARGVAVELVAISTRGDRRQAGPIGSLGVTGVFTKELQRALLDERIDLAVHSLKDLPTEPIAELSLSAVAERGPLGDVLVSRRFGSFDELPAGAVVGTGSQRRRAQLWHARRDLNMADVRGNVDTRVKKLDEEQFDALVLAEAGLVRLGLAERITQRLPASLILPAVGQGALGVETRAEDHRARDLLAVLDHPPTHRAVLAERALLRHLRGGCLAPVGAWGRELTCGQLQLDAVVLSGDGARRLAASSSGPPAEAERLGQAVADALISQGARELIQQAREVTRDSYNMSSNREGEAPAEPPP